MGIIFNFVRGIVKSIGFIAAKVGAAVLFVGILGMLFGVFVITSGINQLFLLGPILAAVVMWEDYGWGIMVLLGVLIAAFFFPGILP